MKLLTSIDHFVKQCFSDDRVIPGKAAETAYDCIFEVESNSLPNSEMFMGRNTLL